LRRPSPQPPPDPPLEAVIERLGVAGADSERRRQVATDAAYAGGLSLGELRVLRQAGLIPYSPDSYDPDGDPGSWEPPRHVAGAADGDRRLRPITSVTEIELASPQRYTFAVMGETRPTVPRMPFSRISQTIFEELALLRPAFVLCTGDIIWGFDTTREEMRAELDGFRALADRAGVPLFNVPGNHEVQSRPQALELLEQWGHDLHGSFDAGPYHFIALNTEELDHEGRVTGSQLEWLESDLAASRDAEAIFVFMHRPLFSWFQGDFNPDDSIVLQKLFSGHGVRAVFSAHDHFFYEEVHDRVRYITVGGGGAPAYAQPQSGGFAHYLLVTVEPGRVDIDVVEPNRIEVAYELGNDGVATRARARVANTTDRDLVARNLEFRMPYGGPGQEYELIVDFVDFARTRVEHPARVREVADLRDGRAAVAVEVAMPTGSGLWVTVEAQPLPG